MGIAGKKSLTSKRALAASALAAAVILIGLSTPRIYDRYKAYIAEPSNPYRHSPLPDLPPLGERVSGIDRGRTITEVQIPPSTNSNAPNAVTGWVVGTPEQIESAGIETEPDARFKKPSLPFPESTAVWHIDAHMGQPLADVTFVDDSGDGRYKIIKISALDDRPIADLYMKDKPVRIMIPLGLYQAKMSIGRNWEGEDSEFGPYGAYMDLGILTLSQNSQQTTYRHSIVTAARALP